MSPSLTQGPNPLAWFPSLVAGLPNKQKKKKKPQSTGGSDTGLYELSLLYLLDILKAPHICSLQLALQAVQNACHTTCKSLPI